MDQEDRHPQRRQFLEPVKQRVDVLGLDDVINQAGPVVRYTRP
jgi:hypothetical protein